MSLITFLFAFVSTGLVSASNADWNYEDMTTWGDHCKNEHKDQSPINIVTDSVKKMKETECNDTRLAWNFKKGEKETNHFKVINNGHSIVFVPVDESKSDSQLLTKSNIADVVSNNVKLSTLADFTGKKNQFATFKNQFNPYSSINSEFCLHSFHAHWTKSEHTVNGKHYGMEIHFMHFSCDYSNIGEAFDNTKYKNVMDKYVLGVIGVFVEVVDDSDPEAQNFELDKFIKPDTIQNIIKPNTGNGMLLRNLNISNILPDKKEFYSYAGSFTTPQCNSIVRWHVIKKPIKIKKSSLETWSKFQDKKQKSIADNNRPVVKNDNPVYFCSSKQDDAKIDIAIVVVVWVVVALFVCFAAIYVWLSKRKYKKQHNTNTNKNSEVEMDQA